MAWTDPVNSAYAVATNAARANCLTLHWERNVACRSHVVGAYCTTCKRSEVLCEIDDNVVEIVLHPTAWIERVIRDALDRKMPDCAREHALDSDTLEPTEATQLAEATCDPMEREVPNYSLRDALKTAYERMGESMPSDRFHVNIGGEVRAVEPKPVDPMERIVDGLTVAECLERFTAWQREGSGYGGGTTTYWIDGVRHVRPWSLDTHAQVAAAREAWSAALRAKQEEARERDRRRIVCDDDRWEVG